MDFSFHSCMVFFTSTLCQTYFVSSIIISLLLFTNAVISSGFNGLCASIARSYNCLQIILVFFIISCIRRFSSDNVIIEAIFSSFNFSILTSSFSSPSSLRKISTRLSDVFWNASFSSSATSSFAPAVTSASILWNLMF